MKAEDIPAHYQFMDPTGRTLAGEDERFMFEGLAWPSPEELGKLALRQDEVNPELVADTLDWIRHILKPEWTPLDLDVRLRAARGIADERDAFLARYKISGSMIQVIVTRSFVFITVAPPADALREVTISVYAEAALHGFLQVTQPAEGGSWAGGPWSTVSVRGFVFGYQRRANQMDWRESVSYLTDGRAVKFSMAKLIIRPPGSGPPKSVPVRSEQAEREWFGGR